MLDVTAGKFGPKAQLREPESRVGGIDPVVTTCGTAAFLWKERTSDEIKYGEKMDFYLDWLDIASQRLLASERVGNGWLGKLVATADCSVVAVWEDGGTKARAFPAPSR